MTEPSTGWRVTSVSPYTDLIPGQGTVKGQNVTWTTDNGDNGSTFVPQAVMGNADQVKELIRADVMAVHAIRNLGE